MNTRTLAFKILNQENRRLEDRMTEALSNLSLSVNDINFLNQLVRGVLKSQNLLDFYAENIYKGKYRKMEKALKTLIRIGLYQLSLMNVPQHAAVNETIQVAREIKKERFTSILNAILRNYIKRKDSIYLPGDLDPAKKLSIEYSHPEWMIRRWLTAFGAENTRKLLEWNNHTPEICFRQNPLRISWRDLEKSLLKAELKITKITEEEPVFFYVDKAGNLLRSPIFAEGCCSVQDRGSSLVVDLLHPQSGTTIIDACAAPGGKATYIAQRIENASVLAYDLLPDRCKLIENEKNRLNIPHLQIQCADATKFNFPEADYVLVDAPCTGTGVMDRKADLRWRKKEKDLNHLVKIQTQILQNSSAAVKPGGVLVYSTCSLEEEENWRIVETFLNKNLHFTIEPAYKYIDEKFVDNMGALFIFPPDHGMDGAFAVRMIRNGNPG